MNVIKIVEEEVNFEGNTRLNELEYLRFHKNRFRHFLSFLEKFETNFTDKKKIRVLEIGSHYLHTSVLLASKGYQVDCMDVKEFWDMDFVQERAKKYGLNAIVQNDLSGLLANPDQEDTYDLIVFTEIMEHITFNPIAFWKNLYKMLALGGVIYISTPNAFALPNYVRNLKNIFLLKSIGITVDDIMSKVTYGHHWKEYSAGEVRQYFKAMSDDFEITINPYSYKDYDLKSPFLMFKLLSKLGNLTHTFADELQVIVRLDKKAAWKLETPAY